MAEDNWAIYGTFRRMILSMYREGTKESDLNWEAREMKTWWSIFQWAYAFGVATESKKHEMNKNKE